MSAHITTIAGCPYICFLCNYSFPPSITDLRGTRRWDPQTFAEFDARANCLSKEYSDFGPENPVYGGRHVDGEATLGENIADEVATICVWALSAPSLSSTNTRVNLSSAESPAAVTVTVIGSNMHHIKECGHLVQTSMQPAHAYTLACRGE
jgi:hypothetical protein